METKSEKSVTSALTIKGVIYPPSYVLNGLQYETLVGSSAFHAQTPTSDIDIFGFCVPPVDVVFPHISGEVQGFGNPEKRFDLYLAEQVEDHTESKVYDVTIFSITKFFHLLLNSNPNVLGSLYTPQDCVRYSTKIGAFVRNNLNKFISKNIYHSYTMYARSMTNKIKTHKQVGDVGLVNEYGYAVHYDTKAAYHAARLIMEVQLLLAGCTVDTTKTREVLSEIRKGIWSEVAVRNFIEIQHSQAELLYRSKKTKLPDKLNKEDIRIILLSCLEEYYGSIPGVYVEKNLLRGAV